MNHFNENEFIGEWKNFELYFNDTSPLITEAWKQAELTIKQKKKNLIEKYLYRKGAKQFWIDYCYTITAENKQQLGGMTISKASESDLTIQWFNFNKEPIYIGNYTLDTIIDSGLEKKVNYLLKSNDKSCFKYVLLMPPMPKKDEKNHGGLISHFHFQFSSRKENILKKNNKLKHSHWYATMCDGTASIQQEREIILALHGIKK